jgi:hypothetical protein
MVASGPRQAPDSGIVKITASGNISLQLLVYAEGEVIDEIAFQVVDKRSTFTVDHMSLNFGKMQPLTMNGTLSPIDGETYQLSYTFRQNYLIQTENGGHGGTTGWDAIVEIKKGAEVVLMKDRTHTFTLKIGDALSK